MSSRTRVKAASTDIAPARTRARDPESLAALGLYGHALRRLRELGATRALDYGEQVLLAEMLGHTGDADAAIRAGQQLLKQRGLSAVERCRVHRTLGRTCFQKGLNERGIEQYLKGIDLAARHGEAFEECQLRVQMFRSQMHWIGPQAAMAGLSDLRSQVHHLGDPATTVTFQAVLAELAAKLGLVTRARRYLDTARALLPGVANRAVHGHVKNCEACVAAQESNYAEALQYSLEVKEIFEETECVAYALCSSVNLGHMLKTQQRLPEAGAALVRGLADIILTDAYRLPLNQTLMEVRLAEGKLDEAGALDDTVQQLLDANDLAEAYYGLWQLPVRVRWRYRSGDAAAGVATALEGLPRVERMNDRILHEKVKLLAAEGLGRVGQAAEGAAMLAEVFAANPDPMPENLAEGFRVAGRLVAAEDPAAAAAHFERAGRIMHAIGNLAGVEGIRRDALESGVPVEAGKDPGDVLARSADRLAALVELGLHPPLLAQETLSLITDTQCAAHAGVIENGVETAPANDAVRIAAGTYQDRRFEVVARPLPTAAARSTLLSIARLVRTAVDLAEGRHREREQAALWPEPTPEQQLGLICVSARMQDLVKTIRRVAATNVSILITGETGVGKELFARALHQASPRSPQPFVVFNCAAATREIDGRLLQEAAGGTLLLDDIGEMSVEAQPALVRALESGELDARVVAASSTPLEELVAQGRFREDLFYRLNVIRIHVPPLRERREEVPALVQHFLERYGRELQKPMLRVSDEAMEYLVLHQWPGNVRQLANEIRRMTALAEPGAVLMPEHLSAEIVASRRTVSADRPPLDPMEIVTRTDQPLAAALEHVERAVVQRALAACDGRVDEAAKLLGLSRKGLYLKRQRLGLE